MADLEVRTGTVDCGCMEYRAATEEEILAHPCVQEALKKAREEAYDEGYDRGHMAGGW